MGNCCSRRNCRHQSATENGFSCADDTTTPGDQHCKQQQQQGSRGQTGDMANRLAPFIVSPTTKHTATVIFLHGLGDTGAGWSEEFKQRAHPWIKYIFPNAPIQPVSLNGGMPMPSWFDIVGLSPTSAQDEAGILSASENLVTLLEEEAKSLQDTSRIVIGGFSQGGAVALHAFLTTKHRLGGVLAFSTWLPLHEKIMASMHDVNKGASMLQCHGDMDHMVPFTWGKVTAEFLKKQVNPGHEIVKLPDVMHSSSPQEMELCKQYLQKVLPQID